jgi:translation elongation factor EF-Tu-like GTPase
MPEQAGVVEHYYNRIKVAVVRVERPLRVGDWVRIRGAHDDLRARIKSIEMDHKPLERAEPGQKVGIKLRKRAHARSVVLLEEGKPGLWARILSWG